MHTGLSIYKNALSFKTVRLIQGLDVASQCNINNFNYENIDVFISLNEAC